MRVMQHGRKMLAASDEDGDAAEQQQDLVYDPALHSLTGRPLPASLLWIWGATCG
jgi:hypothetical protein